MNKEIKNKANAVLNKNQGKAKAKPSDKPQAKKSDKGASHFRSKQGNSKSAPSKNQGKTLKLKPKEKPKHLQKPDPIKEADFKKLCNTLKLTLSESQSSHLRDYMDMLMLWNTRINLVGTLLWKETMAELICDSFYLAEFIKDLNLPANPNTWDLGSGAGLPGIPLRMAFKEGSYTLVEVREKRALFMTTFLLKKPLVSTSVFWGRAEDFFQKQEEKNQLADMILSRAFMPYEELAVFVVPYLKSGATLLLMLNTNLENAPQGFELVKSSEYFVKDVQGKATVNKRYFHALKKI